MLASSTCRGQGTCSDTQNTLGVVKSRDLLGLLISRHICNESGGHLGWFGVPTPQDLVPRRCREIPDRDAEAGNRRAVTCAHPSRCTSQAQKKVLSYSDLPRRKQDWQRSLRSQPFTSQTSSLIML